MHGAEDGHPTFVRLPLCGGQVEVQGDSVEVAEEATDEITDRELVCGRADELDQALRGHLVVRRGGREPKPSIRGRHLEGLVPKAAAEVVCLVDHEQIEAI